MGRNPARLDARSTPQTASMGHASHVKDTGLSKKHRHRFSSGAPGAETSAHTSVAINQLQG